MATLLLAEVAGGRLSDLTARALTAALEIAEPVDVLVAGQGVGAAAKAAAELSGVGKVLVADHAAYAHALAEPLAALIVALAPAYDAIVAPSTSSANNVTPRVAALFDVKQVSHITKVVGPKTFERPIWGRYIIGRVSPTATKEKPWAGALCARAELASSGADSDGSAARPESSVRRSMPWEIGVGIMSTVSFISVVNGLRPMLRGGACSN